MGSDAYDEYRRQRYPHANDPRRDSDFGTRRPEAELRDLLGAILDELYKINDRAAAGTGDKKP